ncbi:MAG: RNA methyltransferase [Armatimonadota bacterium]|nr:RNA methyltransferase [Armatimonadota bacterium]
MITSTRHPLVQAFRRAAERPGRDPDRRVVLDGPRLIADALDAGAVIEHVLVTREAVAGRLAVLDARLRAGGARVHEAAARVVQAAADVTTSQGIVALARRPPVAEDVVLAHPELVLLVADAVQDPGNLGTMIRTAVAAGATAVAVTRASADPWAPKAVRATMGAVFKIPLLKSETPQLIERLLERQAHVYIADAHADLDYTAAPLIPPLAVVIGNEAAGPDPRWRAAGVRVRIPLWGPIESLNAAVAAALLLYEVARRRAGLGPPARATSAE